MESAYVPVIFGSGDPKIKGYGNLKNFITTAMRLEWLA
jgi:hypothetical protein